MRTDLKIWQVKLQDCDAVNVAAVTAPVAVGLALDVENEDRDGDERLNVTHLEQIMELGPLVSISRDIFQKDAAQAEAQIPAVEGEAPQYQEKVAISPKRGEPARVESLAGLALTKLPRLEPTGPGETLGEPTRRARVVLEILIRAAQKGSSLSTVAAAYDLALAKPPTS